VHQSNLLIYADFNGIERDSGGSSRARIDMTGYGTLASLSLHRIRLETGECLTLADPDGLRVRAEMIFDKSRIADRCSGWFGSFDESAMEQASSLDQEYNSHLCFKCRNNLFEYLNRVGRAYREYCPTCGTPVMFPLLPPGD
jgi:hypothetical protein